MDNLNRRQDKIWRVYILHCGDGSFYTGASTDVLRRLAQHAAGRGARYTRSRPPLELWWVSEPLVGRSAALKYEAAIKKLSHEQKKRMGYSGYARRNASRL